MVIAIADVRVQRWHNQPVRSEDVYPKILDALDRFGVKRKISSFVLPLGYSFNLDGSMLLVLMLTSKRMAGVPRASLVVIAATLHQYGIPEAGLLLILGVDTFLDMGRSATNAVGNSVASAVVAKWEGELLSKGDAETNVVRMEAEQVASLSHAVEA